MVFDRGLRFNRDKEQLYRQFFLHQDINACRAISYLAIGVMLILIGVDFFRVQDMSWVLISRLLICLTFGTLIILTYKLSFAPLQLQFTLFFINIIFISSLYVIDFMTTMPHFFLTNSMVTYMFIAVTISGLWFRFGALLNFILIGIFFLYLPYSKSAAFHLTQIVNLFICLVISLLIGLIWERHKRVLFLKHSQMNRILNIFSHDMASPFNSLLGLLELYDENAITQENFNSNIAQVKKSVSNNLLLLQNLVKWSKSQLEGFKPDIQSLNLDELVLEGIDLVQRTAHEKNIAIKYAPSQAECLGDKEMVKLIIRNTLSNAVKFSNPNSTIDLKAKQNGVKTVLEIQDYGIGMSRDELDRLSSLQINSKIGTANEKGSGIGLQITRQFIKLNKGNLSISSKTGEGTLVTLAFPTK